MTTTSTTKENTRYIAAAVTSKGQCIIGEGEGSAAIKKIQKFNSGEYEVEPEAKTVTLFLGVKEVNSERTLDKTIKLFSNKYGKDNVTVLD